MASGVRGVAAMDFDRDVAQPGEVGQARLVVLDRQRRVGHQRDDGGVMAGADAPDMQVGDAVMALLQAAAFTRPILRTRHALCSSTSID